MQAVLQALRLDEVAPYTWHAVSSSVAALSLAAIIVLLACADDNCPAGGYWSEDVWGRTKTGAGGYCETQRNENFLRTPSNALSNIGFVIAGFIVIILGCSDFLNPETAVPKDKILLFTPVLGPVLSWLWGMSYVYIGIGSFIFHASITSEGQRVDVAAMYTCISMPLSHAFVRFLPWRRAHPVLTSCVLAMANLLAAWAWYEYKWQISSKKVLPSLIAALILLVVLYFLLWPGLCQRVVALPTVGWLLYAMAVLFGALGFGIRSLDEPKKKPCPVDRDGVFQIHALFHVIVSWALLCAYLGARAELIVEDRPLQHPEDLHADGVEDGTCAAAPPEADGSPESASSQHLLVDQEAAAPEEVQPLHAGDSIGSLDIEQGSRSCCN